MLYVCLFLLIKKLEQFRTTIHCRCADMAAAGEKPGGGGEVKDVRKKQAVDRRLGKRQHRWEKASKSFTRPRKG